MSDREGWVLDGLDLNDGELFELEDLGFKPAAPKALWVNNPDSDGDLLVEEPHYGPSEFNPRVRIVPQVDMDTALAAHGQIVDKLQKAARTEGGVPLEWTPAGSSRTYTGFVMLGEIADLPITVQGDLAGWFFNSPILTFKATCDSFFKLPESQVLAPVESSAPLQTAFIGGIEGDVPAEARMVLTDKAGKTREHVEWGQEIVEDEEAAAPLLIDSDDLTPVGGEQVKIPSEIPGAVTALFNEDGSGANAIQAMLTPAAIIIARTGDLPHIGSYRLKARVNAEVAGATFQALLQVGDGPLNAVRQDWVEPPMASSYSPCEIDLGEVTFEPARKGTQRGEIFLIAKTGEGEISAWIDYIELIPTHRYGLGRAPTMYETPMEFVARDSFDQEAGELAGKEAPLGGKWEESGDAKDFEVSGSGSVGRTMWGDEFGRSAFLNGATYTDIVVQGTIGVPVHPSEAFSGIEARYSSSTAKVFAGLWQSGDGRWWAMVWRNRFGKPFSGTEFDRRLLLKEVSVTPGSQVDVRLMLTADGQFRLWIDGIMVGAGQSADLATGGELDSGKIGLFGKNASGGEIPYLATDFFAFIPSIKVVCFAHKILEIRSDAVQREAFEGGAFGDVPFYRGSDFYLDPAGDSGRVNRIAVKMRRGDMVTDQDLTISDHQQLEVWATPRFLVPR